MMTVPQTSTESDDAKGKSSTDQRMRQMLMNEEKFEDFIQFMIKEFSSESILSFVEFVQFKQRMIESLDGGKTSGVVWDNYVLSDALPQSSIVFGDAKEFKECAHLLYEKYIKIGAELEVNLSAGLRYQYCAMDADEWKMDD